MLPRLTIITVATHEAGGAKWSSRSLGPGLGSDSAAQIARTERAFGILARRWSAAADVSPRVKAVSSSSAHRPADLDVVRESYDRVADSYAHMVATTGVGDIRTHPWLRAMMDTFADAVSGLGPVLDVGCGPGTITAYLAERGVTVSGVDLSPRMINNARRLYPECSFSVGSSTDLDLADSSLGGVLG